MQGTRYRGQIITGAFVISYKQTKKNKKKFVLVGNERCMERCDTPRAEAHDGIITSHVQKRIYSRTLCHELLLSTLKWCVTKKSTFTKERKMRVLVQAVRKWTETHSSDLIKLKR